MHGEITLKLNVMKGGVNLHGNLTMPMYMPGPVEARYFRHVTFEGISVDDNGKQHYLDTNVAFRQAVLNAITYLKRFGYSEEQAYLLLSAAPIEGRINSVVDIPNALCSFGLPAEIFDFDITPKDGGHTRQVAAVLPIAKRLERKPVPYDFCSKQNTEQ